MGISACAQRHVKLFVFEQRLAREREEEEEDEKGEMPGEMIAR